MSPGTYYSRPNIYDNTVINSATDGYIYSATKERLLLLDVNNSREEARATPIELRFIDKYYGDTLAR